MLIRVAAIFEKALLQMMQCLLQLFGGVAIYLDVRHYLIRFQPRSKPVSSGITE